MAFSVTLVDAFVGHTENARVDQAALRRQEWRVWLELGDESGLAGMNRTMKRKKRSPSIVWLARKLGAKENAAVSWCGDGENLDLQWTSPLGFSYTGIIGPKLARLLAKRIEQALRG